MKNIYLTIDDAPSIHTHKKVDFLTKRQIPALFFCPGHAILKHKESVVFVIENGFLVGNHSFSHPHFSEISTKECKEEILQTEAIIEECYRLAGVERRAKVIRMPFGDRGEGDQVAELQAFLKSEGFVGLKGPFIDVGWDWDTRDYKRVMIQDEKGYLQGLEEHFEKSSLQDEIILIHDFDSNHHLFDVTMNFLQKKSVNFCEAI